MEQQHTNDEIDLGTIINYVQKGYHSFLRGVYNAVQFVKRNWIVLLALIVGGVLLGIWKDNKTKPLKETEIIVQINHGTANYIYTIVEQLALKQKDYDYTALKEMGVFEGNMLSVVGVEIEPIVNITEILEDIRTTDRSLEVILEQAQFEDELLTSNIFVPEYTFHKMKFITTPGATEAGIDNFLAFLNSDEKFVKIRDISKNNLEFRIEENKKSVAYLDAMFESYGNPTKGNTISTTNAFYDFNLTNFHLVYQEKSNILMNNHRLEVQYANADETIVALTKPILTYQKTILSKKRFVYPIALVLAFLILASFYRMYKKGKKLSKGE